MVNVLDSLVGNLTAALTAKGMMKNLVFVYSADNGGGPMDGSNYPYKGGKTNFFEGGIRALAFVYSELLPPQVRGVPITGAVHVCDWWVTFCKLASGGEGAECTDNQPAAHPLDSLDLWSMIVGENATSPREGQPLVIGYESDSVYAVRAFEVLTLCLFDPDLRGGLQPVANSSQCALNPRSDCCKWEAPCDGSGTGALIWGDWKLIIGCARPL